MRKVKTRQINSIWITEEKTTSVACKGHTGEYCGFSVSLKTKKKKRFSPFFLITVHLFLCIRQQKLACTTIWKLNKFDADVGLCECETHTTKNSHTTRINSIIQNRKIKLSWIFYTEIPRIESFLLMLTKRSIEQGVKQVKKFQ